MPTRTQQSDILTCAYASHGDTRHVLVIPGDPGECFTLSADAFDLAERLQTPVFVMSDLDIGMNDWVVDALKWDDSRRMDRGKVLDAAALEAAESFGRYRDVDGDGIPWRTIPGAHPEKGAYFTRGTSHTDTGSYTEDGVIHARMLDRIGTKFETAQALVPETGHQNAQLEIAAWHHQFRLDRSRRARSARPDGAGRLRHSTTCACAPFPSPTR